MGRLKFTFFFCLIFCLLANVQVHSEELTITGSSTVHPVVVKASEMYKKEHPIIFNITGGGSSHGVQSAATGQVAIGAASRKLKKVEINNWPNLRITTIGFDGVAIIVNKSCNVAQLTRHQVRDIYLGKISSWK
jgi:phosphate transport system substrate-binding protein